MSYIKVFYLNLDFCCDEFKRGVELLEQSCVQDSIHYFKRAYESVLSSDQLSSKYASYYGLSRLLNGEDSAILLCRKAARSLPVDGDICMNLARAELFLSNRLNALKVIEIGLKFSSGHDGLRLLRSKVGVRQRKPLPFLSRNNYLSTWIGKRMRK